MTEIEAKQTEQGLNIRDQILRPRTIISFLISLVILIFIFARQNIPVKEVIDNARNANLLFLVLGFAFYYATFYVRTIRWQQVLNNSGYSSTNDAQLPGTLGLLRIILLSWFANSVLPAKLGDGYRGYLLKRNAKVSFSKTMGTIFAERVADVGVLFTLLLVSGIIAFRTKLPPHFVLLVTLGGTLALASFGILASVKYVSVYVHKILPGRVRPFYSRLEEGILLAFSRRLDRILLLTALIWILESARFWAVAVALGASLTISQVIFLALAASLLTTIPFTPAGFGVVEGAVITVLQWVYVEKSLAGSIALIDRGITYWSVLLVGGLLYLVSGNK
ncbi:conserved hypothetical protein [Thermobaculum terrenum ATCC BAA-798]|uniref:Flippase-like domain-containing protein n=1 Tax=Thermobaculum terrenum (strain ATCC BAA-798 / CCMEE 7001 / YNP1) TaxID=525904 RepID=D1CCP8_THET1|nr:lysylphosphatidylglycerol synthase transmembrane domain-containing protein [Thermobaculum terrenum]ACZ42563.1 conserved hypothetical protein [Thermobaculum terrenum ATCC BAA-798]